MKRLIIVICLVMMLCALNAYAGGPFIVDEVGASGKALQWIDKKLTWSHDDGPLSVSPAVTNAEGVSWVRDAMNAWTQSELINAESDWVVTTGVTHHEAGGVGEDIDATNLENYLAEDSTTAAIIVFDDDGSIMESLGFDADSTLGLSQPLAVDETGMFITRGIVIINGRILNFLSTVTGAGYDEEDLLKAALIHEVGHLFNLDHTQFNLDLADACELGETCTGASYLPTMFPELKTYRQGTLSRDDKITISWIYPNSAFESQFCTITGEVRDGKGNPLQGVNVIARAAVGTAEPRIDVRTMVSGVLYPACTADGHYYLRGIIPGKTYHVTYEQLSPEYTGASGFEPLDNPPSGFAAGTIIKDGSTTVSCVVGGETIEMDPLELDVSNPCSTMSAPAGGGTSGTDGDEVDSTSSSGGKCELVENAQASAASLMIVMLMGGFAIVLMLSARRRTKFS